MGTSLSRPKISVVTITYNNAAELPATIESVLAQTYPNLEYIVIDGASQDNSAQIIRSYQDRIAHWVSEPDKSRYDAMNKGAAAQWLCSDSASFVTGVVLPVDGGFSAFSGV